MAKVKVLKSRLAKSNFSNKKRLSNKSGVKVANYVPKRKGSR